MTLYVDTDDVVIADLAPSEKWSANCEQKALEYAREHDADWVIVYCGANAVRLMLVPPDCVAA